MYCKVDIVLELEHVGHQQWCNSQTGFKKEMIRVLIPYNKIVMILTVSIRFAYNPLVGTGGMWDVPLDCQISPGQRRHEAPMFGRRTRWRLLIPWLKRIDAAWVWYKTRFNPNQLENEIRTVLYLSWPLLLYTLSQGNKHTHKQKKSHLRSPKVIWGHRKYKSIGIPKSY